MNIVYYLIGSLFTFIGIIIYRFFTASGNGVLINTNFIVTYGIISLIAGVAFFLADWMMQKVSR